MTHQEYAERVDRAAGTDIDVLEDAYVDAMADGDFAEAGRLLGLIYAARAAAGLDPRHGYQAGQGRGSTTMTPIISPFTDQVTLDRLVAEAEAHLEAARRWAATVDLHAPLAVKLNDQARMERARIELEALRELVAEA